MFSSTLRRKSHDIRKEIPKLNLTLNLAPSQSPHFQEEIIVLLLPTVLSREVKVR